MKRRNNLFKYDAPLSIQYKKGYGAFFKNRNSIYNANTMQHREWQRGFDTAYFAQLKKVKQHESRRRSQKIYV